MAAILVPRRVSRRQTIVGLLASPSQNGPAENLKSFGRRRRTKVVDERTRGEQALVYGEFDFQPMRGRVRALPLRVWRVVSLQYWCAARRFVVLQ